MAVILGHLHFLCLSSPQDFCSVPCRIVVFHDTAFSIYVSDLICFRQRMKKMELSFRHQ